MKLFKRYNIDEKEFIPLFSDNELIKLTRPVALFVGGKDIMFYSEKTSKRLESLVGHAKINFI